MLDYLSNCLSLLESRFPKCAFIILGDYNKLNLLKLRSCYNLKRLSFLRVETTRTLDIAGGPEKSTPL